MDRTNGFLKWAITCCFALFGSVSPMLAAAQDDLEFGWPRELDAADARIVIYQPQLESFENNRLEARAAVSVTPHGGKTVFGAVWLDARMETDFDERIVTLESLKVTAAKFPDAKKEHVEKLSRILETEIPQWEMTFSLDRLLAGMTAIESGSRRSDKLNDTPPEIIHVDHPAVLVLIDGDPVLTDMEGYDLKYVVNTAFFIVQDPGSKRYYLKGGEHWFVAGDPMGDWQATNDLPGAVAAVARRIDEEEAKQKAEQGNEATAEEPTDVDESPVPEVIVRTTPAEIVQINGEPDLVPIEGTQLLYVQNTENDIIMDISSQRYYLLISGRWFAASSLDGASWKFVPNNDLPADFAKIPPESDMSNVLTSVAGTQEAKEAVLENQIPQTAEVDRRTASVTVTYDGDPQFEKCAENGVAYAVNTDKAVLLIDGMYFCCDQAVWFRSRGPEGPWEVCTEGPEKVEGIPPECPVYNVKYVYIYDSTPEVVYVGYTPGYVGAYYYHGCVVWGTGYWYRPWYHYYYYPRPVTFGFGVHYNPWTGWGFSFGVSYGWLNVSFGRPYYGGWWGAGGYHHGYRHGYYHGYRHGYYRGSQAGFRAGYRAGQYASRRNVYKNRGTGVRPTGTVRGTPAGRGSPAVAKKTPRPSTRQNNVYADKKGNVYRNQNGNWQKNQNGNWSSSKNKSQNLNRDRQARQRGNQRATQSKSTRSRGGAKRR